MHERTTKKDHADTIMYEIDMLRHCASTLPAKKAEKEASDYAKNEYNLCIEGFLLHLRNLLGFFTNLRQRPDDLIINDPVQWANHAMVADLYSDLTEAAKKFNVAYGVKGDDGAKERNCYGEISKYLQHCTALRYVRARDWNIEKMFADFDPILSEFKKRFVRVDPKVVVPVLGAACNHTASQQIYSFSIIDGPLQAARESARTILGSCFEGKGAPFRAGSPRISPREIR